MTALLACEGVDQSTEEGTFPVNQEWRQAATLTARTSHPKARHRVHHKRKPIRPRFRVVVLRAEGRPLATHAQHWRLEGTLPFRRKFQAALVVGRKTIPCLAERDLVSKCASGAQPIVHRISLVRIST